MKLRPLLVAVVLLLALTACTQSAATTTPPTSEPVQDVVTPERTLPSFESESRLDEQGAVTVAVTPLNLGSPGDTLDFEIAMNTHSVDLSMDLTQIATLTTDTGKTVEATAWDGPSGGHHVSGTLSFPAAVNGAPLLEGASTLTLTIRDVDVPERVFVWDLGAN